VSVSESITQNALNALQVATFTDFYQTCHHGSVPGDVITYCLWWKSGLLNVRQTGSGINSYHCSNGKIRL